MPPKTGRGANRHFVKENEFSNNYLPPRRKEGKDVEKIILDKIINAEITALSNYFNNDPENERFKTNHKKDSTPLPLPQHEELDAKISAHLTKETGTTTVFACKELIKQRKANNDNPTPPPSETDQPTP